MTIETALASAESQTAKADPPLSSKQSEVFMTCALNAQTIELLAAGFLGKVSMDHDREM